MFRYETFKIFYLFRDGDTLAVRTICVSHTQMEVVGNADQRQIMSVTFLRRTAQAWSLIMGTIINCWIKCNLLLGAFKMWNFFFTQGRVKLLLFITLEERCNSGSEEFVKF